MIAAMTAAAMSSADSVLSCNAAVVMQDIYRRYINPGAADRALLRVAEWTTLGTGIAAALLAYLYQDIISVLVFVYDFWAPAMVLPFLVGLFWYRPHRAPAVVASMAGGSAATILWLWLDSPGDVGAALFGVGCGSGGFSCWRCPLPVAAGPLAEALRKRAPWAPCCRRLRGSTLTPSFPWAYAHG